MEKYLIRDMLESDLPSVVDIHLRVFPNGNLSYFGTDILTSFYNMFLKHPDGIAIVAHHNNIISGFCIGWLNGASYQHEVINLGLICWLRGVLHFILKNPLKAITFLSNYSRIALKLLFMRRKRRLNVVNSKSLRRNSKANLLSIGVHPNKLRLGIGNMMVREFERQVDSAGIPETVLTVLLKNKSAIKFYQNMGWKQYEHKEAPNSALFIRNSSIITSGDNN